MDLEVHPKKAKRLTNSKYLLFFKVNKNYTLILLVSRLILSVCQSAVSLDTWNHYKDLSRIQDKNYDLSLDTLVDYTGDLSWVPNVDREQYMPQTYGTNKLFTLYLIRLSHYFHRRITNFILYFSSVIFFLLVFMCLLDLIVLFSKRFSKERLKNKFLTFRFLLYSCLFGLVFSQFIFLLYYRTALCSMETLYPFIFVQSNQNLERLEFLKVGTCKMSQRFLSIYVMSFLTLVPDAFLILIGIIAPLRSHSFLNGMKYFGSIFFFITAFIVLDFRNYISYSQNPKILDYATEKFNEQAIKSGRTADLIKLMYKEKNMKMFNMKDTITYKVYNTLKTISKDPKTELDKKFTISKKMFDDQSSLSNFNFSKQLYTQTGHSTEYYFYFGLYASMITLIDAIAGTVLIVKRHRFLLPIVAIVNFVYFFSHIINAIMLEMPLVDCLYFCKIKEYVTEVKSIMFETLAISDLVCKIRDIYRSSFAISVCLVVLAFVNVVNLYFIHKSH